MERIQNEGSGLHLKTQQTRWVESFRCFLILLGKKKRSLKTVTDTTAMDNQSHHQSVKEILGASLAGGGGTRPGKVKTGPHYHSGFNKIIINVDEYIDAV